VVNFHAFRVRITHDAATKRVHPRFHTTVISKHSLYDQSGKGGNSCRGNAYKKAEEVQGPKSQIGNQGLFGTCHLASAFGNPGLLQIQAEGASFVEFSLAQSSLRNPEDSQIEINSSEDSASAQSGNFQFLISIFQFSMNN
jgi:hypothetical protein